MKISIAAIFTLIFIIPAVLKAQDNSDSLKTTQLDEIVVTGQYEPQSLRKSVYQVRVISPEIIRMRNATNVQSILNTELGIRYINDPVLGTADISLMGMSGQNVKILLDGVPLVDRGSTRESLNQIDVNTIERIEIVEGPMSVIYGADALAGVINIITRKPAGTDSGLRIDARILEETAGKEYDPFTKKGVHNESVNANWKGKKWNAGGGVTRNTFGGWDAIHYLDDPTAKNFLPKEQVLGQASVGLQKDNLNAWYRLNYVNEVITTPGTPINNQVTEKEYITNRFTHQAQGEWEIKDNWSFTGVASYQNYSRRTRTTQTNLTTGKKTLSLEAGSQDEAKFNSIVFRGTSLNKISRKVSLQSGIDINVNEGSGERIDRNRSIGDYAVFASSEVSLTKRLSVRPGVRFIYNTAYSAPPVVPSLNAKIELSEQLDLRASYGYGFRAPALRELYFSFFDANHSIRGNTGLKAEYSNSTSLSLNNRVPLSSSVRLNTTLLTFYNVFDNMITLGFDAVDPTINTYVNIYKYKTAGGTFNNTVYWKNLTALVGVSYIAAYNRLSEDDTSLPSLVWSPEVNTNITYNFEKIGASLSLFYKWTGERKNYQTTTVNGQTITQLASVEDFQWADVSASKKISKSIDLTGGVKNLFNITRLQNTSQDGGGAHTTVGAVNMSYGRSYFLGLNIHWSK